MRTIRPFVCPSERLLASALRNTLPDLLKDDSPDPILAKFLREHLDLARSSASRKAA